MEALEKVIHFKLNTRRTFLTKGAAWTLAGGIFVPNLLAGITGRVARQRHNRLIVANTGVVIPPFDGDTFFGNTASTPGGDGTTNLTNGSTRAFASCNEAYAKFTSEDALFSPTRLFLSGTSPDTQNCVQGVSNFETTSTNRLYVIGNNTSGKWNTSAWRMTVTDEDGFYNNLIGHATYINLQVQLTGTSGSNLICYRLATANNLNGPIEHYFIGCIARLVISGATNTVGFSSSIPTGAGSSGTCKKINCIVHGGGGRYAYNTDESGWAAANDYNYNCTNYGNNYGWLGASNCVNCLSTNTSIADFDSSVGSTGHSNNASEDGSAKGTNLRINQTFAFVDVAGEDFHLASNDTGAKDFGLSDPASGLYLDDIDGQVRTGSWSIGADEPA